MRNRPKALAPFDPPMLAPSLKMTALALTTRRKRRKRLWDQSLPLLLLLRRGILL
jgi:hypothetical protein